MLFNAFLLVLSRDFFFFYYYYFLLRGQRKWGCELGNFMSKKDWHLCPSGYFSYHSIILFCFVLFFPLLQLLFHLLFQQVAGNGSKLKSKSSLKERDFLKYVIVFLSSICQLSVVSCYGTLAECIMTEFFFRISLRVGLVKPLECF